MRQETRFKFNAYLSRIAELNGIDVGDVSKKFSVEPSVTQTLMDTVQESSEFLTKINIVPVSELRAKRLASALPAPSPARQTPRMAMPAKPGISPRWSPTSTSAIRLTSTFTCATKPSTCGRVFRISSCVSATPSSSVRRSISSWPALTA